MKRRPSRGVRTVIAGLHVLGDPVGEGGLGDEQAVRALMLLVRTARWLNEIVAITCPQQHRVRNRIPSPRVLLR